MDSQQPKNSRRHFLVQSAAFLSATIILPQVFGAEGRSRAAAPAGGTDALVMVDPKEPIAVAVHYVVNKNQVKDKAVMIERQGVPWKEQQCSKCSFYTAAGADRGKCTILGGKGAYAVGFCQSWGKKS